ncbi:NAD-dependent epimerase [Paenibacillus sp. GCM10027627]|uniref:NAD-dependent epimerase n=1 Tax=unclassified Paenibacillus TaxID=185978 RepID=UPI0036361F6D
MNVLVTGAAGFIGFHAALRLLSEGVNVVGLDNLNDYYDPKLKTDRLSVLRKYENFTFYNGDLIDALLLNRIFNQHSIQRVLHLAAQAGVRYSLQNPKAYIESNVSGFINVLECCRQYKIQHLLYASSSSVYGSNIKTPFSESDGVDHPVSLYAATKKSNELMAHSYSHLFQLPTTGLRFFTVYGPWGRPDMAYFSFTKKIIQKEPIQVFNNGEMKRDFTYIDDIINAVRQLLDVPPKPNEEWDRLNPDPSSSYAPYKIYNIGNNKPVMLLDFIRTLEKHIGSKAIIEFCPMQAGDVKETYADIERIQSEIGFKPLTSIEDGLRQFVEWYKNYY